MKQRSLFNLYLARTAGMLSGARRVAMLLLLTLLTTATAWADSAFSGGDGSSGSPYMIANTADLNQLAADVNGGNGYNGKYFVLTADITYDGTENNFTLIGDNLHIFYGTFDGDGKTISGINTNKKTEYQGIFGFVDGTVKNLFVSNCSIVGVHTTGVIAGQIRNGTIENCRVENNVTLSGNIYVGGIVGYSHGGTIKGCTSAATITGTQSSGQNATLLGGVVGATSGNSLTDNIFTGTITGDLGEYIGAIVGQYKSGTLTNNLYTSTGFGGIGAAGSTTGADGEGATVFVLDWATQSNGNSEATAYIINDKAQLDLLAQRVKDGNDYSGKYFKLGADIEYDYTGLSATESNYTAIGDNSHQFAGIFDGNGKTISGIRIYKGGDTNADKYQGLFGKISSTAEVKNVTLANATITGYEYIGGIVGYNDRGKVTNCHVTSDVTFPSVQPYAQYHGGIVGYNDRVTTGNSDHGIVTGCTSAAAFKHVGSVYNTYNIGGIVGYNQLGTVSQCIYLGTTLQGDHYVGAIVGYNNMATVTNCYFTSTTIQGKNSTTILDNAESAVGYNREGAVSNCGLAHKVTLGEGITLGAAATEHGLLTVYGNVVAMGYNDGTATTFYSKSGNVITLGNYSGTVPDGYNFGGYSAKDADNGDVTVTKTSGGYTFTMPAKDVTVSAILTAIPWSGSGDNADAPYIILYPSQLDLLAAQVNAGNNYEDKFFKLGADITYDNNTANNFTPIGDNNHTFYGTFDGDGKTISGININSGGAEYQGIFGLVDGTVKNLVVSYCSIVGKRIIGAIAGALRRGTIENCHVENNVTLSGWKFVGGIVGASEGGTIKGCTSAATITGTVYGGNKADNLGGVVGTTYISDPSTLTDNIFTGTITGDLGEYIGAIVGQNNNGTLTNNHYTSTGFGGIGAEGSTTGADGAGARKALTISAATDVTLTPTGAATTYDVSGITVYADNSCMGYGGKLYAGATDEVKLTLAYSGTGTVPEGYIRSYSDGSGKALPENSDGSYTLTMPAADVTVSAFVSLKPLDGVKYIDANGQEQTRDGVIILTGDETILGEAGTASSPKEVWYICNKDLSYSSTLTSANYCNVNIILADGVEMKVESSSSTIGLSGSLGIYGQSTGTNMGKFTAKSTYKFGNAVSSSGSITISHCKLIAECSYNGISSGNSGDIIISGAEVTATGDYAIYSAGGVSITGGKVTANGTSYGIYASGTDEIITISGAEVTATGNYAISAGNGSVSITDGSTVTATSTGSSSVNGIYVNKDVTISSSEVTAEGNVAIFVSSGGVSITGGKVTANGTSFGINVHGYDKNITIEDAEVTATGDTAIYSSEGDVSITGGKVTANGTSFGIGSNGYDNGDVTIIGSEVTATANGTSGKAISTYGGNITIKEGAEVTAEGKYAIYTPRGGISITGGKVTANGTSFGIGANNDITISNAEVTATATDTSGSAIITPGGGVSITGGKVTANGTEYGIEASGYEKDITIKDAEVKAEGNYAINTPGGGISITGGKVTAKGTSYGIEASGSNKDVTIKDAEVTAEGKYAIYTPGGGISITGGKVTANGTFYGIGASGSDKDVTIKEAEVTATATGTSETSGNAIFSYGSVSITDSEVTATADGTSGHAIYAFSGGVSITGSKVTANGTSCGIKAYKDVELDWTNATDFIFASSYEVGNGNAVIIPDGKRFVAYTVYNTNPESPVEIGDAIIAVTVSDLETFTNRMLRPLDGYCVAVSEGLNIVNRTPDFAIGSLSYYNIAENDNVTITPNTGYVLKTMSCNDTGVTPVNGAYTFTMPADNDVTVTATLKKTLTNTDITISNPADQVYTGSAFTPAVSVTDGETDITDQCDFAYSDNINVGTATVTITAKTTSENYAGETTKTFKITKAITDDDITVEAIPNQTYTGAALTPEVTVTVGETTLVINTDFTVTLPEGGCINAGDYTVTITGIGKYSGELSKSFKVVAKSLSADDIFVGVTEQTYTGSALTPAVSVTDGETNIADQCDFTYSNNTNVGTATVTITAKATCTNYTGEVITTFPIFRSMDNLFSGSNLWTGYVAEEDLEQTEDLKAYIITALGEETVIATPIDYIPKGLPVLLKRKETTKNSFIGTAYTGSASVPAGNLLKAASPTSQPTALRDYGLYQDAFVLIGGGTLATGKVYLAVPQSQSRAANRAIIIDEETTSLREVNVEGAESGEWFDLQGRKLDGKPAKKGVYIHNGKKEVVR